MFHGIADGIIKIGILPQETGLEFVVNAQHIVHYQHLAVAIPACADADSGYGQAFGNFFGQFSGNFFQYNGKTSGFLQYEGICFSVFRLRLLLLPLPGRYQIYKCSGE